MTDRPGPRSDWEELDRAIAELRAAIGRTWIKRRLLWLAEQIVRLDAWWKRRR